MIVGRAAQADLRLDSPEISRRHCRIAGDGEAWQIEDLGSRVGTRVNGEKITGVRSLHLDDLISLGPVTLRIRPESAREQPMTQTPMPPTKIGQPIYRGREVDEIPLAGELLIGRAENADVILPDPRVSRSHAQIQKTPGGFRVVSLTERAESLVNGQYFDQHDLVIGDQLQFGPFYFRFNGRHLQQVASVSGGTLNVANLCREVRAGSILENVSLHIERCQFVGILGPSGSGKSTLLGALSGLRPADSGAVKINNTDLYSHFDDLRTLLGYVPQEDIVHRELTVRQALVFSARLRLAADTPRFEIEKLAMQTIDELGLTERASTEIWRLSGGQVKRVSVAAEVLSRPPVLFLDEPTSGLDPATEFKMMELLRNLAGTGCTVLCTTHLMENVHLMDLLAVLLDGRLIFAGSPEETRAHFGVQRLTLLFDKLEEKTAEEWAREFEAKREAAIPTETSAAAPVRRPAKKKRFWSTLPILLQRQWAILRADPRNFLVLFGQPLAIGALVTWASNDVSLILFFAYVATLWFGCSNGVQEIVKEIPIYRRERIVGLGRTVYLASKFVTTSVITAAQAGLLYGWCYFAEHAMHGSAIWQMAALCGTALTAAGIGLAISALARTSMQAVMLVPLILIPQILFSGYTVKAHEMSAPVLAVSRCVPTFAAQTMMDVSLLWQKKMSRDLGDDWTALLNLRTRFNDIKTNQIFDRPAAGLLAAAVQMIWIVAACLLAWIGLRAKERA